MRGELRLRTLRAVEDKLGRLLDVLIDAEVGVPALRIRRQPHGPAFRALRDQRDALERHAASLGRRRRPDYSFSKTCACALFLSPRYHRFSRVGVAWAQSRALEDGITVEKK